MQDADHLLNITIQSFKPKTEELSLFNKREIPKTKGRNVNKNYGKTKNTLQEVKQKKLEEVGLEKHFVTEDSL